MCITALTGKGGVIYYFCEKFSSHATAKIGGDKICLETEKNKKDLRL